MKEDNLEGIFPGGASHTAPPDEVFNIYKGLLDSISDLAYVCDTKGNILYVNNAFERLSGHKASEFIGRSFAPLFDEENLKKAVDAYTRTLNGESPEFELYFKKTGILCEYRNLPMRDSGGNIVGVMGSSRDITERKRREDELKRRDDILEAVTLALGDFLGAPSWEEAVAEMIERLGKAAAVSRILIFQNHRGAEERLLTSRLHEWAAHGITRTEGLVDLDYRAKGFGRWVELMGRGEPVRGAVSGFPRAERDAISYHKALSVAAVPVYVEKEWWGFISFEDCASEREWSAPELSAFKAASGALGYAIKQRMASESLRESEQKYRIIFEKSPIGIFSFDKDGTVMACNENFINMLGSTKEKAEGFNLKASLKNEKMRAAAMEALCGRVGRYEGEYTSVTGGRRMTVSVGFGPVFAKDGSACGGIGIAEDITEREKTNEMLRKSQMSLTEAQRMAHIGSWEWDAVKNEAQWSEETYRIFGVRPEDYSGRYEDFINFIHPDDRGVFESECAEVIRTRRPFSFEHRIVRPDGEVRHISNRGEAVFDGAGRAVKFIGTSQDITEARRATEELNKYRANLEAIFRSVNDGIVTVDMGLVILEMNERAEALCGLTRDAIGKNFATATDLCDFSCAELLREAIAKQARTEAYRKPCRKGAQSRLLTLSSSPLLDGGGSVCGAVLVIRDETRMADLEKNLDERKQMKHIAGTSKKMLDIFYMVENLSDIQTTVLITGESGTGKELVAEAIHYGGLRADKPLVKVNCAGLPEHLLESELFGHVKGAFTGAVKERVGRFQLADGGSIFLDEIGDLSFDMQLRLLRILQNREFERVGDSKTLRVDIRIIAATNKDLTEKVRRGEFREDLYYRLKVVELALPPLRERLEDLPSLTEHFIEKFNKKFGRGIASVSADVQKIFMGYPWPGNIRELEHAVEHAFILCRQNIIGVNHLPVNFRGRTQGRDYYHKELVPDERSAILKALARTGWNKTRAAGVLGMSRRTIYRKMERYGISDKPPARF